MKKLFFAAILATVAIGGAYATPLWAPGSTGSANYDCTGTLANCQLKYPSVTGNVYTVPETIPSTGAQNTSTQRLINQFRYNP